MNRTIAILILVAFGCLFLTSKALAQAAASSAPAAAAPDAAPPATATPAAAATPNAQHAVPPAAPVAPPAYPGDGITFNIPAADADPYYTVAPSHTGGWIGGVGFGREADPEMQKLVQSEHELSRQSDEMIAKYGSTDDGQLREKLKGQLRELLAKQFDVQRQRRELELARVEERLSKLREQLKRRDEARATIIDRRLENLTSDAEGLGWTPPAAGLPGRRLLGLPGLPGKAAGYGSGR